MPITSERQEQKESIHRRIFVSLWFSPDEFGSANLIDWISLLAAICQAIQENQRNTLPGCWMYTGWSIILRKNRLLSDSTGLAPRNLSRDGPAHRLRIRFSISIFLGDGKLRINGNKFNKDLRSPVQLLVCHINVK